MTSRISHSLAVSAITHAGIIIGAALLLSSVSKTENLPEVLNTFVLVATEANDRGVPVNSSNSPARVSLPAIPRPLVAPQKTDAEPEKISRPVLRAPAPAAPARLQPSVASSKPQISFETFQTVHGKKPPAITTHVVPHVVAPSIPEMNIGPSRLPSSAGSDVNDAEKNAFTAELVKKLRESYQAVGGEDRTFFCRIEFSLSANGRVASSRILKSSGNRAFDDAVRDALVRLRVSTPPKALVDAPLTTTFQVEP